jgi:hypothetical protein
MHNRRPNPRVVPTICLIVSLVVSTAYTDRHYQLMLQRDNLLWVMIAICALSILRYAFLGDIKQDSNYPMQDMLGAIGIALILGADLAVNLSEPLAASLIILLVNWRIVRWLIVGPRPTIPTEATAKTQTAMQVAR